jgi:proteasome accessory factor B
MARTTGASKRLKRGRPADLKSRPPYARMLQIHDMVQRGNYPNATSLAGKLEVTTKTIHRDIGFMRDRFNLPIEYDASRNGYNYTASVDSFPMLQIDEGELFALLIAEKVLQQYRGTVFEKQLSTAFRKISESLPDTVSMRLSDWDDALDIRSTGKVEVDEKIFDLLFKSVAKGRQLEIIYTKPNATPEKRIIDPYQIANINNDWYLYAYDHKQKDLRCFVPARMESAKITGQKFKRPDSFSLDQHLSGAFGPFSGNDSYDIRIQFTKTAAPFICEKQWHPTQKLKQMKNGGVEISLKLSHLTDIRRWILGWGGEAKVLAPEELLQSIENEARAILKK